MTDSFSAELWAGAADIYAAILEHPFLTGLTDGTLPPAAFDCYVVQDALYLRRYAQALAALAARAPSAEQAEMFARHAAEAISVERRLHGSLLAEVGIDPSAAAKAEPAPACLAYTSYLLATVTTGSFAEGVAAVLPCYWIYWEAGKHLERLGSPDPRYQTWIGTYAGEEFGATVREVLAVTDELGRPGSSGFSGSAGSLSETDRMAARRHFRVASRYEWMFWDMGYRQETWPV